jgi:hypothetical protein
MVTSRDTFAMAEYEDGCRHDGEVTMILRYELWDMESSNQVASFDEKGEAIAVVTDYLRINGVEAVSQLVLGAIYRDDEGTVNLIPVLDLSL